MTWIMESTGEATCMKDYVSMHAPVVELCSKDDLVLALKYLHPALNDTAVKTLGKEGDAICAVRRQQRLETPRSQKKSSSINMCRVVMWIACIACIRMLQRRDIQAR